MKLKLIWLCLGIFACNFLFAYNPPLGGEQLEKATGARALVSASSVAGGGIFFVEPHSVLYNPALLASENSIDIDLGFSFLRSFRQSKDGGAFQAGFSYPWQIFVSSVDVRGNFASFEKMSTANTVSGTFSASKEITENLGVGISVGGGNLWGSEKSWQLVVGLGAFYRIPSIKSVKDVRFGVSLLNLGKNFSDPGLPGIDKTQESGMFPGIATFRVGAAANFVETDGFVLGAALDISAPSFQNAVFDLAVDLKLGKNAYISIAESLNVRELVNEVYDLAPSVSFGWRFVLNKRKSGYMGLREWQSSEMRVDAAWKALYADVNAFSGNVLFKIGINDMDPPNIWLWEDAR